MSAKYRSGFEYFTEVFSKEYKVDKSILAGAAREVWENELTDEDRASWEEMARLSEQEESAAKAAQIQAEDSKAESRKQESRDEIKKAEEEKKKADAIKAEEEKKAAEAKKAEDEKKAAEAKKAEEEKKAAEAKKAEEEKKAAEAKKAEEEKKAAEAKKAEEEKKAAEAKKAEEERKAAEAKKAEEEKKAAEAKKAEEEKKAAEAKKAEEEKKAAEAKKAEEEKKAAEAKKAEEEKKAAEAKKAEEEKKAADQDLSSSKSPISGTDANMLGSAPDVSQKISMGTPPGTTGGSGMEAEKPKEPMPTHPPSFPNASSAPEPPAGAASMDIDRLKQAIGKRVSPREEEPSPRTPAAEKDKLESKPGASSEQDQQSGDFRDTLSSSGFFTSSGPIKSGLTISANKPRQVAKEAPVDRTSDGHAPESIPEIQDPSAVSLDAPSAAVMRQKLMEKADELADAVISKALEGDVQALTLCIERVLAPAEEYRMQIDLPPLDTQEHILQASEAVVRAVSLGELDPQQAKTLHELIEAHWRILEGSELGQRVHQLEQRSGGASKRQKITLGAFDKPF